MSEARKELIRKAFKKCDTSGDGVLKVNDLKVSIEKLLPSNFLGGTGTSVF